MTRAFESRVIAEGIVDTKVYRYVYECKSDAACIKRIHLYKLDTTAALTDWEIIKEYR